jgi:hypothetical protein
MYVIDYRVRTNKPMIISTNFSLADIEVRMPALVRLLGLMRREGNVSGKAVKRAIDAVRDGLVWHKSQGDEVKVYDPLFDQLGGHSGRHAIRSDHRAAAGGPSD